MYVYICSKNENFAKIGKFLYNFAFTDSLLFGHFHCNTKMFGNSRKFVVETLLTTLQKPPKFPPHILEVPAGTLCIFGKKCLYLAFNPSPHMWKNCITNDQSHGHSLLFPRIAIAKSLLFHHGSLIAKSRYLRTNKNHGSLFLKGHYHEIFVLGFFHQTAQSGYIRDVLGPFWILANFQRYWT